MFSYVFMKILESRPQTYDRRMDQLSRGKVSKIKRSVINEIPESSKVLEIGCGTGQMALEFVKKGASVDGFDLNPKMVEETLKKIESEGLEERFSIKNMGVEEMDGLDSEKYDAVVSVLVFSELSDDERRYAFRQTRRVLKKGGLFVIADEVLPRQKTKRFLYHAVRLPAAMTTYLVSQSSTRPFADLPGDIVRAGFDIERAELFHGGSFSKIVARRPAIGNGS